MSELTPNTASRYRPKPRLHITIEGEEWEPRSDFATRIGVVDRTVARMNLRTTFIGGLAYVPVMESLRDVAARAHRRHEPTKHRRKRG
jgi:hypothetical protein